MNWFNFDIRKAILLTVLIIMPLFSINMQQNPTSSKWFEKPFSFMAGVVEASFFHFSDTVRGTTKLYLDLINIKKESAQLKSHNLELKSQLLFLEELKKENTRLNNLLSFKTKADMNLLAAHVTSKDLLSTDHSTLRIDRGTAHGIKSGMAVITTEGVIGHIFRPETYSSRVLLITDRYSVVDGMVSRSRARGIIEGRSNSQLMLRYVEKSEDIKKDDIVVTSGLDNIFPKGFPIAIVERVENKSYAVSLRVDLRPIVDPNKVEEVFVVTNANNQDFTEKMLSNSTSNQEAK